MDCLLMLVLGDIGGCGKCFVTFIRLVPMSENRD